MNDLDAKSKILEAGLRLFAEQGFDGTSTRDIAKASGLNISLISYYFGGKEGLYKAILEDFAMRVQSDMNELIKRFDNDSLDRESLREAIEAVIDKILDLRLQNPYMGLLMAREKIAGMPHSQEIHQKVFIEVGEKVVGLIRRGQKQDFVRKDLNPHFFMCMLSESIMGYILMYDCNIGLMDKCYALPQQRNQFKKQLITLFLEGIYL